MNCHVSIVLVCRLSMDKQKDSEKTLGVFIDKCCGGKEENR